MTTGLVTMCARVRSSSQAGVALFLCLTLSGCIGATPLPKRTRTATGTEVKTVDMGFIHPGQTTRIEVQDKLRVIDTGLPGDRFFVGRWSSSTWGGWIILAGMCCEAVGGGGRVWKTGNLLVEFDNTGFVKRVDLFDDRKIIGHLTAVAENSPLQLDPPIELQVMYLKNTSVVPAKIMLSAASFDLQELGNQKKKHTFSVPAQEVLKVDIPYATGNDPTYLAPRIHCAHDLRKLGGPRGKSFGLQVSMPQLLTLMSYASHMAPSADQAQQK
jgi:hypothetical protein